MSTVPELSPSRSSASPVANPIRTGNCNSRCASIAAFTADIGDAKAATKPSPVWLNKNPSYSSIAVCNTLSWTTSAARIACASDSHRRVEPSTSVNKNVTTPEGGPPADTRTGCHTKPTTTQQTATTFETLVS